MFEKLVKLCYEKKIGLEIIREGNEFSTRPGINVGKLTIVIPERNDFILSDEMIERIIEKVP